MQNLNPQEIEKEFLQAYDLYADAIFRHCYFRINDRERAKELMQEVMIKAWLYLREGKKIDNIRALLYKMANNIVIDEVRKKKSVSLDELKEEGFEPEDKLDQEEEIEMQMEVEKVMACLPKMNPKYREIFVMRYVDQLSPKEIADIVGESENLVSVRLNRAIKQLRQLLKA